MGRGGQDCGLNEAAQRMEHDEKREQAQNNTTG